MKRIPIPNLARTFAVIALAIGSVIAPTIIHAQDRLKTMPGYEHFQKMSREMTNTVKMGSLSVTWTEGGKAFEYPKDGKRYRYDIAARKATELTSTSQGASSRQPGAGGRGRRGQRGGAPERGRQFTVTLSPDGKLRAFYRDRNLWLSDADGTNEVAITTDGNEKARIKNGTGSWVYGEELAQTTAMWWSTNSHKIAFYRFDESKVPDFYLTLNETKLQDTLDTEAYPKAGAPNPIADILVYDVNTKKTVLLDVRDGKPFDNAVVGHYVYGVTWSADGKELLFHRTNRRQNILEFCAADPETGKCRVLVHEEWPASWVDNSPPMRFLKDGKRFIWTSERTGWKNFYLYDLGGNLLATLTGHPFDTENIVRVDEDAGLLYYMAHDGDNPMKLQLHRVGLDGKGDTRLTDPAYHHAVDIAPDGRHFVDIAQTHEIPPATRLLDAEGKVVAELAKSDMTRFKKLGLRPPELLKFKAADGTNDLYGMLYFPSQFKSWKTHPLLVSVYGGPETVGARETFTLPNAMPGILTEYGFLVATFDSRSASGRGKHFLDAIYMKLGQPEIDDQSAGVKSLWSRRYVDKNRVGIFGTSYGGYASVMSLLRYPDVYRAASASSPPTAWYNYDTIYTERYMWLPAENKKGYEDGDAMHYVNNLKGRLMIYCGTADNNVHPNNSMQLIQSLQRAGKSFDVQIGPDQGHSSVNRDRMMEFFIENLAVK